MAEVTAETISEAMKLKEADEAREKQFGELVEFKANAETLLNELNDKIEKQATEIESLKGGFVPRDEYDADVVKLQGAIEATGKVKFGD